MTEPIQSLLRHGAFEAASTLGWPDVGRQRGLGVAAGQQFYADYVVAADRLGDFAEWVHAR